MASVRRRLTANGPSAAYDILRSSQKNGGTTSSEHSSAIPNTFNIRTSSERVATSQNRSHSIQNEWSMHERRGRNRSDSENEGQTRRVRQNVNQDPGLQVSQIPAAQVSRSVGGHNGSSMNLDENDNRDHAEVPGAFDRLQFESLKKQVKEYRATVANLQKIQTKVLEKVAELPRHCKWECVSKVLTDVVSGFLVGSDTNCSMYPSDTQLISRILESFGIKMEQKDEVEKFLTEWGRGGQESLMLHVYDNIRDRRGAILRVLRAEFYIQLGLPKPRDGEEGKVSQWKMELANLKRNREWRVRMTEDLMDPWGTPAVHHSIARVLKGIRFDPVPPVTLSIQQAGFFLYNLELAIEGRVMEASRMNIHHKGMHDMEERIKLTLKDMKRIIVLV